MIQPQTREPTKDEKKISDLEKEATRFLDSDIERAILCLREANYLKNQVGTSYPILSYARLAKFLYKAGRFTESIAEFEKLIEDTPNRVKRKIFRQDYYTDQVYKQLCKPMEYSELSVLYDEMAKIYKKEKLMDKADDCWKLSTKYEDKVENAHQKSQEARKNAWSNTQQKNSTLNQQVIKSKKSVTLEKRLAKRKKENAEAWGMLIGFFLSIVILGFGVWIFWKVFSFFI